MENLKKALLAQPLIYVARDFERALGLSSAYRNYYIITNKPSFSQKLLREVKTSWDKKIITIADKQLLDTHELLNHKATQQFLKKIKDHQILVFKNTPAIEKICQDQGWNLLNPRAELSNKIEEKISQVKWLGELKKFLPSHRIDLCKNIKWENTISSPARGEVGRGGSTKFILQFNRAHTGSGTILIESEGQLKEIREKFPDRPVRVTEFIDGPMFTNNNVVWGKKVLCGNINYQITGLAPFTDRPFATIGNDWGLPHKLLNKKLQNEYCKMARAVGKKLARDGWKGLFGIDVVLDQKKKKLYLIEINARQPASTTYESQLQERQKSKVKSQKLVTTFEAHLVSLLGLKYNGEELIKIKDGAQIIQRVTNEVKNQKSKVKGTVKKLEKLKCNVITYDNHEEGADLIRIQGRKNFLEDHNQFNELGEKIKYSCNQTVKLS
jgi:predicted ATP-grasp superfamily ATP-dependent carboligase